MPIKTKDFVWVNKPSVMNTESQGVIDNIILTADDSVLIKRSDYTAVMTGGDKPMNSINKSKE